MKTLLKGFFGLILLLLTSCTNSLLFDCFDYKTVSADYVYEHAKEIKTQFPFELSIIDEKGNEIKKKVGVGTLVKVFAIKGDLGESTPQSYSLEKEYLIELPDGSRGFAIFPEACLGLNAFIRNETKDSALIVGIKKQPGKHTSKSNRGSAFPYVYRVENSDETYIYEEIWWKMMRQYPIVEELKRGKMIQYDTAEKKILGKTLEEIEERYCLAENILVQGKKKTVVYQSFSLDLDSVVALPLTIYLTDNVATSFNLGKVESKESGFMQIITTLMRYSYLNVVLGTDMKVFPRFDFYSTFYMGPIWRLILSALISIVLSFLYFSSFLPRILQNVFYIKALSNEAALFIAKLLYWILALASIVFFMIYLSVGGLIVSAFLIYLGLSNLSDELYLNRCPFCRSYKTVSFLGKSDKKQWAGKSEKKQQIVDLGSNRYKDAQTGQIKEAQGGRYQKQNVLLTTRHKSWKENFYCDACDTSYSYKKHESETDETVTGGFKVGQK